MQISLENINIYVEICQKTTKKLKKQENHIMGTLILTPRSKFIWKYLYISHFFDNWKIEPLQMTDQIFFIFYITKNFCKV